MRGADKMLLLLLAWSNPVGALGESGGALSNAHKSHTHTVPPTAKPFPQDLRPAHPAKDKLVHGQQTRAATPAIPLAAVPPSTEAKPGHAKERLHAVLPTEVRPPHKEHKQGHAQPQPSGTSLPPPPPPPPSSSGGGGGLPVVSLLVLVAIGAFAYSKDLGAYVGDLSAWGQQIGAFAVLVTVQVRRAASIPPTVLRSLGGSTRARTRGGGSGRTKRDPSSAPSAACAYRHAQRRGTRAQIAHIARSSPAQPQTTQLLMC